MSTGRRTVRRLARGCWVVHIRSVGTVVAAFNMMGNIAGVCTTLDEGGIVDRRCLDGGEQESERGEPERELHS
jgi:hypothetical protein